MWRSGLRKKIEKIVGKDALLAGDDLLQRYSRAAGNRRPQVVCFPQSAQEISQILEVARAGKAPIAVVIPPVSPAAAYPKDSVVVDLTRMNKVLEIDSANLCAIVEPLAELSALNRELEPIGLAVRSKNSDAATALDIATVAATGMQLVLPNGRIANIGGKPHDALGYSMTSLFAASDVRVGILSKIVLRLARNDGAEEAVLTERTPVERELLARVTDIVDPSRSFVQSSTPSADKPA